MKMAKVKNEETVYEYEEKAPKAAPKAKFDFTSLNTLAVVSLASAVTGVGAAAAVITGHVSLAQIKKSNESGGALAIAGIAAGYTAIALWILSTLGFVALSIWGARNGGIVPMPGFGDHMGGFGFDRDGDQGGFQIQVPQN
jgi:hypothetical protein